MEWLGHETDREDLYKTHVGRSIMRSEARQSIALESMLDARKGRKVSSSMVKKKEQEEEQQRYQRQTTAAASIKEISVADHVRDNPFLKRYANLIDNLAMSSLPSDVEDDIVVHIHDRHNATVRVFGANLKFAGIGGSLCVYPTEHLGNNILCASEGQERAMFFNSMTHKWTHGCNTAFDIVDAAIMQRPSSKEITASTKELRKTLRLSADEKLNITHYINFVVAAADNGHGK